MGALLTITDIERIYGSPLLEDFYSEVTIYDDCLHTILHIVHTVNSSLYYFILAQ